MQLPVIRLIILLACLQPALSRTQAACTRIPFMRLRGGACPGLGRGGGAKDEMSGMIRGIRGGGSDVGSEEEEEEGYGDVKIKFDDLPPRNASWGSIGPAPQMHADEALRKVKEGCSLLLLDFPKELDFGVDMQSWITGPKFKGLKMIPSGLHFMYWSAGHGIHQGIWFRATPGRVLVHKWDESLEDLAPQSAMPEEERERYIHGVKQFDFDSGMAPYPQGASTWKDLTHFIDDSVLQNVGVPMGSSGISCHIMPGDPDEDAKSDNTSKTITSYWPAVARTVFFARVQLAGDRDTLKGIPAQEVTELQMDSSPLLDRALQNHYKNDPRALLGEFQLAFVNFVLLSSYSGLVQWKRLVSLLCNSGDAMKRRPSLYYNFLSSLEYQLLYAPEDWFRDELTQDSFLKDALVALHDRVHDLSVEPGTMKPQIKDLVQRSSKFFRFLQTRFDLKIKRAKVQHSMEDDSPRMQSDPSTATLQQSQNTGPSEPEVDIEYVRRKYNKRMKWAVDGSKIMDSDEDEDEASSDDDGEGDGPMVIDFVDETQVQSRPVAASKPLKRGFFGGSRAGSDARQKCTDKADSGDKMEDEESQRMAHLEAALRERQKGIEEALEQIREKRESSKQKNSLHVNETSDLRSNASDRKDELDGAAEVTARMRELDVRGRIDDPDAKARRYDDAVADRLADEMADGAADNMADELADQLAAEAADEVYGDICDKLSEDDVDGRAIRERNNALPRSSPSYPDGPFGSGYASGNAERHGGGGADDVDMRLAGAEGIELMDEELDTEEGIKVEAMPNHEGMRAMAAEFESIQSGYDVTVPNPHYRPPEDVTVSELPQASGRFNFHPEEAKRLQEKMNGAYRGPMQWMDNAQAEALLNAQQQDVDNMYASIEQQGTGYIMSDDSGILVDLRGPEMLVFGPPKLAQQLINASAMAEDYGKPVVYVDALEPESRQAIMAQARMRSQKMLRSSREKSHAPSNSDQAVAEGQEQGTRLSEAGWDRHDTAKHGNTASFGGEGGLGGVRESGWGVSKPKRQGELNDYSCFDKLQVSEDEREEEIHMCPRCDFKRPADLEIKNKNNGTVVDRMCSVCAEYADDDGTPLKRDPWMLEEPDWWKDIKKDPKEEQEEMLRQGYVPTNSV